MMADCKFCESLQAHRNLYAFEALKQSKEERKAYGKHMSEYSAALIVRHWYKKQGKKHAGRIVDFKYRGVGYELNYCPECGKEITKE